MARELREVVYVDGLRTAFGRAGPKGFFWKTRADDMAVKVVRELLRRNPSLPPERIGDVIFAATAQVGDQGLTMGRDVALLAGIPHTVPGFALDRMCAGALTAVTSGAGEIAMGAADVVLAGGVEHMGHHPMGAEVDFNPRFVAERLVDDSAVSMGATAENLHDRFPQLTKEDADRFAVESQRRATAAWSNGIMRETVIPMSVFTDDGWTVADRDQFLRPDTSLEGLAELPTPFRVGGRVTAGNSAGLTDGATAALLASEEAAAELGLEPKMRLVGFAFAGVEPELMGIGPIPATERVLAQAGLSIDDVGLFEVNEPFAVQVLSWCDGMGVAPDDPRLNPYGGAIACGHPLAATGVRLMAQLAYGMKERPDVRYGLTALCVGMGMGAALLWERRLTRPTEFKLSRIETEAGTGRPGHDGQRRGLAEAERVRPRGPAVAGRQRWRSWRAPSGPGWCSPASRSSSAPARTSTGSTASRRRRRARVAAPATSSSGASGRCRSRPWRRSTAPASGAASRSRSTATTGRSRARCGTSPAPRSSSASSRPGAGRSSFRGSPEWTPLFASSSRIPYAKTGC